jgi:hypothetical protein
VQLGIQRLESQKEPRLDYLSKESMSYKLV